MHTCRFCCCYFNDRGTTGVRNVGTIVNKSYLFKNLIVFWLCPNLLHCYFKLMAAGKENDVG